MSERDAVWALQQYEAIRSVLPAAHMPKRSVHAENLGEIADLFDAFLLDVVLESPKCSLAPDTNNKNADFLA